MDVILENQKSLKEAHNTILMLARKLDQLDKALAYLFRHRTVVTKYLNAELFLDSPDFEKACAEE